MSKSARSIHETSTASGERRETYDFEVKMLESVRCFAKHGVIINININIVKEKKVSNKF